MAAEYQKDFTRKHLHKETNPLVESLLRENGWNRNVSCRKAHEIAGQLNMKPEEVGKTIDILNIRIEKCELGLFGYYPERCIVKSLESVDVCLQSAISSVLVNGRLPCSEAFEIAIRFNIQRLIVSGAAEKMGVRISKCQLGAF